VSLTNVENGSFKKVLGNLKLGKWNRRVRSQIIPTFCWQGTHLNFIQIKRLNESIKVTNRKITLNIEIFWKRLMFILLIKRSFIELILPNIFNSTVWFCGALNYFNDA
jgi:hypothetical protein